jgi:(2R)-sulfolactate sulfo-lyase subunit alpha
MAHKFLVHEPGDMVGVAVEDIPAGVTAEGRVMKDNSSQWVQTRDNIPLGHKVALCDIVRGEKITKYGVAIGEATADIKAGEHVHVHNLRSIRWRASTASAAGAQLAETR